MPPPVTQDDNLILQTYMMVSLLAELENNNLTSSDFFEQMNFGAQWMKPELRAIGITNQGCMIIALFAMLVIPKEIVQTAFSDEYEAINAYLNENTQNTNTTYRSDRPTINFIRHVRNAVAHARISFPLNGVIIFEDENRNETFYTELPLNCFGELLTRLEAIHVAYSQQKHKRYEKSENAE